MFAYVFRTIRIIILFVICAPEIICATFLPQTVSELINAITKSNTNNQDDIIDLSGQVFSLVAIHNNINGLPFIGPDNNHTLTIQNGTIERSTAFRTPNFRFLEVIAKGNLNLSQVTFQNGQISGNASGGAINVNGNATLSIDNCTFQNNSTSNVGGAIIFQAKSMVTQIGNSTFSNNVAGFGGAIYFDSAQVDTIFGSIFSNNTARGDGGAIELTNDTFINKIADSSFHDNTARINGGALVVLSGSINEIANTTFANNTSNSGGAMRFSFATIDLIANTTISGNTAVHGGAIFIVDNSSIATIANSTITRNSASYGGGLRILARASIAKITSSIIANNSAPFGPDVGGPVLSESYNLIGNNKDSTFVEGKPNYFNSIVGTVRAPIDPLLASLADNGGFARTHALQKNSPAINAGANPLELAFDQRGEGFLRTIDDKTDIGSFESSL